MSGSGDGDITPNGARRIYRVLCRLAWCDGELHPRERGVLDAFRQRYRIDFGEASQLEAEGQRGENLRIGKRPAERSLLLDSMIDVAAADGQLVAAEQKRLLDLATATGVGTEELVRRIQQRLSASGRRLQPGE